MRRIHLLTQSALIMKINWQGFFISREVWIYGEAIWSWKHTIKFLVFFFSSNSFFEWAFARHHNTLSWYIRPLFIIPIIWSAYKKLFSGIAISIFCLFTSMFWFSKPNTTNPEVEKFLNFEANYLKSGWTMDKIALFFTVIIFFVFIICLTCQIKLYLIGSFNN